jgi:hypothetical protein
MRYATRNIVMRGKTYRNLNPNMVQERNMPLLRKLLRNNSPCSSDVFWRKPTTAVKIAIKNARN